MFKIVSNLLGGFCASNSKRCPPRPFSLHRFAWLRSIKMLTSSPPKKDASAVSPLAGRFDQANDLKFISELGRSLLFTFHPKKVASRVAEAIQQGVDADICVFVAELENIGLICCACGPGVETEGNYLRRSKFEKWLGFMPPQIGYSEETASEFLIGKYAHGFEYISPLHINGEIKGAIITGFSNKRELTEQRARLIDAATQMAAMSVNLSAHYGSALDDSINEAREEHRKFTESILDALPVSL